VATLRVILHEFAKQRGALRQDAFAASEQQVTAASKALNVARASLTRYLNSHPSSTRSDPQLSALAVAERNAVTQLANATENVNQASLSVSSGAASQTTLRVVDAPLVPVGPTTGKARLVKALAAGLFAGVIISILGIVALARYRRSRVEGRGGDAAPRRRNAGRSRCAVRRARRAARTRGVAVARAPGVGEGRRS
jgi:hypothetical protein